jgi:catechol 2,3-dioxygenase-like lactoylglutathione lyase family enzyme
MRNIFPTICTDAVAEVRDFYCDHLDFEAGFDSGWYVQLASIDDPTRQLGIVERTHATVPEEFRTSPAGVLISIELDDVDDVHQRIVAAGHKIVLDLRSEDFGQRHFMTVDPAGTLVDVITQIEPSDEYVQYGLTTVPGER